MIRGLQKIAIPSHRCQKFGSKVRKGRVQELLGFWVLFGVVSEGHSEGSPLLQGNDNSWREEPMSLGKYLLARKYTITCLRPKPSRNCSITLLSQAGPSEILDLSRNPTHIQVFYSASLTELFRKLEHNASPTHKKRKLNINLSFYLFSIAQLIVHGWFWDCFNFHFLSGSSVGGVAVGQVPDSRIS